MKNLLKFSGILLSLILAVSLIQCGGGNGGGGAGSTTEVIETDNYIIGAGETVEITGDLIIRATGSVNIVGSLVAVGDNGQSITIEAEGDIDISGIVTAGKGSAGTDGGTLTIISFNGSITISGTISAGDGGDGEVFIISSARAVTAQGTPADAGGNGGHLILRALNGSIDIAIMDDIMHVGNGGKGTDMEIHGEDLLTFVIPETLTNSGGHSGGLILDSPTVTGVTLETVTLVNNFPPDSEEPLYLSGEDAVNITSGQLSGGNGGDAGSFSYGVDEEGNSTWPQLALTGLMSVENIEQAEPEMITVPPGRNGGFGIFSGGNGSGVVVEVQRATVPGSNGQSVTATGGNGGDALFGVAGAGGRAFAGAGRGADGADPDQKGGDGGDAIALGGSGGFGFLADGPGADATAFGGLGGKGGDGCPPGPEANQGGFGGKGGTASATAGFGNPRGDARAFGGIGGSGSDGRILGGTGGKGGSATAFGRNVFSRNGEDGIDGGICPTEQFPNISVTVRIDFFDLAQTGSCAGFNFPDVWSDIFEITTTDGVLMIRQLSTGQVCVGLIDANGNFNCQGQQGQITFRFNGHLMPDGNSTVLQHTHEEGGCISTWEGITTLQ